MKWYALFLIMLSLIGASLTAQSVVRCGVQAGAEPIEWSEVTDVVSFSEEIVSIPLVIHVVWSDDADRVSQRQIEAQVAALNADFAGENADFRLIPEPFRSVAAAARIQFCIAGQTPLGEPTTGIIYKHSSDSIISQRVHIDGRRSLFYDDLGGSTAWSPQSYLNVYVCRLSGFLGIATAANDPTLINTPEDAVLLDARYFGTFGTMPPYHLGRTLTHEIGHYLGLAHLWGNRVEDCDDEDGIKDTPLQGADYRSQCPTQAVASCGSIDQYMNFMNYTDDACMWMFTQGQVAYMHAFLSKHRAGLLKPTVCSDTMFFPTGYLLRLFPNPANDYLHLAWASANHHNVTVNIFDLQGRTCGSHIVRPEERRPLFVGDLESGMYLLQCTYSNRVQVRRFIKM